MAIDGWRCHYLDEGRGEPIVMLHGNPTWSFYFRSLVHALAPHYRTIVPDHIGCGLSDKPPPACYPYRLRRRAADLEFLLDRLGLTDNLTLVLHDWGGMIGLVYALHHPERVRRLVVTNTAGFMPPGGKSLPWRLKLLRHLPRLAEPLILRGNLFARAALFMAARGRLPRDVRRGLIAPYDTAANRMATLKFVQDIPLSEADPSFGLVKWVESRLTQLAPIPMLICWGLQDFVFDRTYLAEWRRRFPAAEVHAYPQAGHYLLEDAPLTVAKTVRDFLAAHPLETPQPPETA